MLPFTVCPVGDTGLLASFEQRIAQSVGAAVAALNTRVAAAAIPGVSSIFLQGCPRFTVLTKMRCPVSYGY